MERRGLGPSAVEEELRTHFCNNVFYTSIGNVMLSVNPFRELPIYDDAWMEKYSSPTTSLPPHIFEVGARAYNQLMEQRTPQLIMILGGPCAGKSTAMGHLLDFLVHKAGDAEIDECLTLLPQLLQPFLSVHVPAEVTSWASTRAIVEIKLTVNEEGVIHRAHATVRSLEASRAALGGANFEALLLALKHESARQWVGDRESFAVFGELAEIAEHDPHNHDLQAWIEALNSFEIDVDEVVQTLCGLLLLGEVKLEADHSDLRPRSHETLDEAARALEIEPHALLAALIDVSKELEKNSLEKGLETQILVVELYQRIVAKIVDIANDKLHSSDPDDEKANITIMEIPAHLDEPSAVRGFEALGLQLVTDTVYKELLSAVTVDLPAQHNVRSHCARHRAAQCAVEAVIATDDAESPSLITFVSDIDLGSGGSFTDASSWADQHSVVRVLELDDDEKNVATQCEITGSAGKRTYVMDSAFIAAAQGKLHDFAKPFSAALAQSSCGFCAAVGALDALYVADLRPTLEDLKEYLESQLTRHLQGEDDVRPWLVCCLRPNRKGTPTMVSRPVLLQQVQTLQLADAICLGTSRAPEEELTVIWPQKKFLHQYAGVAELRSATDGAIACQFIVDMVASSQGIVGSEAVYGTFTLMRMLDEKVAELTESRGDGADDEGARVEASAVDYDAEFTEASWGKHVDTAKEYSMRDFHGTLPTEEQVFVNERRRKAPLEELRQELADKEEAMDMERGWQEHSWRLLEAERERMQAAWKPGSRSVTARQVARLSSEPFEEPQDEHDPRHVLLSILPERARALACGGGRLQLPPSELQPTRSMSAGNLAILHSSLMQMAATLRVAKEGELQLREEHAAFETDISDLKQECSSWKAEADRLWRELQEMQRQVRPAGGAHTSFGGETTPRGERSNRSPARW